MFDHVGIAVSDLAASERFYRTVLSALGVEPSHADAELVEWEDWDIGPTDREHPVTRGLHVGFRAPSRQAVDAFWQAGIDAGFRDDGAPGPRAIYGPDYYGGFLLDPDGNSAEAVHSERSSPVPPGQIDHLWIRVADLEASKRFYTTIAPHAGIRLGDDEPGRVQFAGARLQLLADRRRAAAHGALPPGLSRRRRRDGAVLPRRRARRRIRGPRRARRAPRVPPGLLRRLRPGPRRAQRRGRQPQPLSHGRRRRTPPRAAYRVTVPVKVSRPPPGGSGSSTPLIRPPPLSPSNPTRPFTTFQSLRCSTPGGATGLRSC